MNKIFKHKKFIINTLLLILIISNFSVSFAYWASQISGSEVVSEPTVQIGQWSFEDTALIVQTFKDDYQYVLSLTTETVEISDQQAVEDALSAYGLLSDAAKAELEDEHTLLLSLLNQILALQNSIYLDFEGYVYDSLYTGIINIDDRNWYGNQIAISNAPAYDVFIDTRSLGIKSGSYFESRDLFINGIDKITLYHGALNYNNGSSFQFRVEYELASNPGVWNILQQGGSNLLIDVISGDPLTYTEIDVNITEALNIRFTPVISNANDYINLDNIRIYEHITTSALEVTTFRTVYAGVLALTVETVEISDKANILQALSAFNLLSIDAQNELSIEETLINDLLAEITYQETIILATAKVVIAENTFTQFDLDDALLFVNTLPNGDEKSALLDRLNDVQDVIDEILTFEATYQNVLLLTVETVEVSDKSAVEQALTAYNLLSAAAKANLTDEKALLDLLLTEINSEVPTSVLVDEFRANHNVALALTTETIELSDQAIVELALSQYELLTIDAKNELSIEKALLDNLMMKIDELEATHLVIIAESTYSQVDVNTAQAKVSLLPEGLVKTELQLRINETQAIINSIPQFRDNYQSVLALTVSTVNVSDKAGIEAALAAYGLLSEYAKLELALEQALLIDLLNEIIAFEQSEFIDFEAYTYAGGLTGTVVINDRTWYGNNVYIDSNPSYDVWIGTRSLALNTGAYFESRDYFLNGIEKITLYHGALNYNNGASFQFRVEYELASSPGVWVILQEGGSDLLIDVISGDPLTFTEINVNITEALNIRFRPVISTTTDYMNLDDIRIFEYQTSSEIEVSTFRAVYAGVLQLTVGDVSVSDKAVVEQALAAYVLLSIEAKAELTSEKALLDSLLVEINNQLPTAELVDQFRLDHADALALTVSTVGISDKAIVELALAAYDVLSTDAKSELTSEKALLDSLILEILETEATTLVEIAESSFLQTDIDVAQLIVNELPLGTLKTSLQNRLNAVQNVVHVELAKQIILDYFAANTVFTTNINNNNTKQNAFLAKANEITDGLGVTITVTNSQRLSRTRARYTINVSKNGVVESILVTVDFTN